MMYTRMKTKLLARLLMRTLFFHLLSGLVNTEQTMKWESVDFPQGDNLSLKNIVILMDVYLPVGMCVLQTT